jgi:hypothetical protein
MFPCARGFELDWNKINGTEVLAAGPVGLDLDLFNLSKGSTGQESTYPSPANVVNGT